MATSSEFAARGKVTAIQNGVVVFQPSNTNYELYLKTAQPYTGPVNQLVSGRIRVKARKVYTVPSGGGFIAPIFGTPRTIQGWALHVDNNQIVIKAGAPIIVDLPESDDAVDLSEGPIGVGKMVNAVALPGATFELLPTPQN